MTTITLPESLKRRRRESQTAPDQPKINAPNTPFTNLVLDYVAVHRQLATWDDRSNPAKLSASAFLVAAITNARTTRKRVEELRERIRTDSASFPKTMVFLSRSTKAITESTMRTPPTAGHAYLRVLGGPDATGELATLQSHPAEAFCVAVLDAIDRDEGAFGDVEDWASHTKHVEDLERRRDTLARRIATEWTAADVTIGALTQDSLALITFKISGDAITLAPLASAAERLANFLASAEDW